VFDVSLWEYSYDMVSKELELTKKKKQALDNLLTDAKISQATHEYLDKELVEAISDLGVYQKSLGEKMSVRAGNLEKQINTLELFLANLEIHHAAGEIEEDTYNRQIQAIILGLEATRLELSGIIRSLSKGTPMAPATPEVVPQVYAEPKPEEQASTENVQEAPLEEKPTEEVSTQAETVCGEAKPEEQPQQTESVEIPTLVTPQGEPSSAG